MSYEIKKRSHYAKLMAQRGTGAGLFAACWRKYTQHLREGAIDSPDCDDDVLEWLDSLAGERVNNSGSRFYIYG